MLPTLTLSFAVSTLGPNVHDFSRDFLVGTWSCRDEGPRIVNEFTEYEPIDGGAGLMETANHGSGNSRGPTNLAKILFNAIPHRYTWGLGAMGDPAGGYVSAAWFRNGVLRMQSLHGHQWFKITQHGHNAFVFTSGGSGPGLPLAAAVRCTRTTHARLT